MLITLCVIRIILRRLFAYLGRRGRRPLQPYFTYSLTKYIKYGALYKTDNLVFYSLKRKYHLRLSEQTAFGFLLSKSTVTHPNIRRKKVL